MEQYLLKIGWSHQLSELAAKCLAGAYCEMSKYQKGYEMCKQIRQRFEALQMGNAKPRETPGKPKAIKKSRRQMKKLSQRRNRKRK